MCNIQDSDQLIAATQFFVHGPPAKVVDEHGKEETEPCIPQVLSTNHTKSQQVLGRKQGVYQQKLIIEQASDKSSAFVNWSFSDHSVHQGQGPQRKSVKYCDLDEYSSCSRLLPQRSQIWKNAFW